MKYIFNLVSTGIFFIAYQKYDMFLAIKLLILFSGLVFVINFYFNKKIDKIYLFNFITILLFGSFSLLIHNSNYMKCKITFIYFLMFLYLLIYQIWKKESFLKKILGKELILPNMIWKKLDFIWAIFFLSCSIINLYITFFFSENIWVNFKIFGLTILTIICVIISVIYINYCNSKEK